MRSETRIEEGLENGKVIYMKIETDKGTSYIPEVEIKNSSLVLYDSENPDLDHRVYHIGRKLLFWRLPIGYAVRRGAKWYLYILNALLDKDTIADIKRINSEEIEHQEKHIQDTLEHYKRIKMSPWWLGKLPNELEELRRIGEMGIKVDGEKYMIVPVAGTHHISYDGSNDEFKVKTGAFERNYSINLEISPWKIIKHSIRKRLKKVEETLYDFLH